MLYAWRPTVRLPCFTFVFVMLAYFYYALVIPGTGAVEDSTKLRYQHRAYRSLWHLDWAVAERITQSDHKGASDRSQGGNHEH